MATLAPPAPAEAVAEPAAKKKGGRKKVVLLLPVLLVLAVAGWMLLKPGSSASATEKKPVPGPVVALDPITLNLADGRYLKLGLALQVTKAAGEAAAAHAAAGPAQPAVDGAAALDAAISVLGDRTYAQLLAPGGRAKAKAALAAEIERRYDGEVMQVYLTQFVMQ